MASAREIDALRGRLGDDVVSTDRVDRATRAHDAWSRSLLRREDADPRFRPDAVVFGDSLERVVTTLRWATETRTPVIPRAGGSGVAGGARAIAGAIVLDLARLDAVLEVDETSSAVRVEAGVRGDRLEEALEPHGLTTGHYPQSLAISSVGGWIAASSAGQASARYGAIEDLVLGLTAVLADGTVLRLPALPRSASGPDLRRLIVGSEGTLAVVVEATLACAARPASFAWDAFAFSGVGEMFGALVRLARVDAGATFVRGYDEPDAMLSFSAAGHGSGCVVVAGYDASAPGVDARRAAAARAIGAPPEQAAARGARYGEHWLAHRNDAVALYRSIMGPGRSLGAGVAVDTMEVAALWRDVPSVYRAVRDALARHAELVACHVSHLYGSGSSLYFTFLIRAEDDARAADAYDAAWDGALLAAVGAGGALTHHHGVGRLKARHLEREIGAPGVAVLRSIKAALDPAGILNPGALLP